MRCTKCNSPLISGEPFCKICGTKVEDMPKGKDLEVIDFDFDDEEEFVNEVIENSDDLMDELEDVKLESTVNLEPVSLEEIKNTPVDMGPVEQVEDDKETTPQEIEIDLEDDEKPEMSQTLIDIMMKPIDLEDTIKFEASNNLKEIEELSKEEVKEEIIKEVKEEPKEEIVEEVKEEPKEEVIPVPKEEPKKKKEIKSKEHDATNRTVKSLKPNTKDGAGLTIVILAIILIVSIILNVYLFISGGNEKPVEEEGTTTIIKTNKVVFGGYEISVNNGWIVNSDDITLTLSDNSNEWVSKTFVVEEAKYSDFVKNTDEFMEQMKEKKYQFTSNYEKKVDGSKLYLFKGKFESYTTYLIVSAIDKETLSVTELKFENEVNDKTLDKVMSTITSIEVTNNKYDEIDTASLSETIKANSESVEEEKDTEDNKKSTSSTTE